MQSIFNSIFIVLLAGFFSCNNGVETIKVRNDKGQLMEKYTQKKGTTLKQGVYISYYEEGKGKKFEEANYVNDQLHGLRTLYYENGQVQTEESYVNGKFEGVFKTYYENGNLQLEGQYIDNVMSGEWKGYYENGQLKEIVHFENNEENGPFTEFHVNGKIKAEGTYLEGDNEHGLLKLYNEQGELVKKMECDKGKCQTSWTKKAG